MRIVTSISRSAVNLTILWSEPHTLGFIAVSFSVISAEASKL